MQLQQLINAMIRQLENLNDTGFQPIDLNTVHSQVLSSNDGFGLASSKNIYRALVRWILRRNGHQDKPWPSNWMSLSVTELANKLI